MNPNPAPASPGPAAVAERLMSMAVGSRHGIVSAVDVLPTTFSDVPGVWHASVPAGVWGPASPSGGVGWTKTDAVAAALGESLERYAAGAYRLPERRRSELGAEPVLGLDAVGLFSLEQVGDPAFPYAAVWADHAAAGGTFADVYSMQDGRRWWAPRFLVGLGDAAGHGLATSSGLAAGPSRRHALLRATQELVERDALMTTWAHGLPGRRVALPKGLAEPVAALGGSVAAVDATPEWSPHPVAIVCGWLPMRGLRRVGLGAACRATWAEAVDKAFLEWCQGVLYAGVVHMTSPGRRYHRTTDVRTFEDHAAYYTFHPDHWDQVPLRRPAQVPSPIESIPSPTGFPPSDVASMSSAGDRPSVDRREITSAGTSYVVPPTRRDGSSRGAPVASIGHFDGLVEALESAGVRLFCRDLTTCDLAQIGVYAVRVLSPDLTPIHCDEAWPYRGGRSADIGWRYPWAAGLTPWSNPWPHPLG